MTPEPASVGAPPGGNSFVIQKHAARRLHYDFRLELDGALKSWAVTKGPSLDSADRRLAVHVEDHPVAYGGFEGIIPQGQYGGGTVMIWDQGTWEPVGDPHDGYRRGRLKFKLHGARLKGGWTLVRMGGRARDEKHDNWLLIKERDEFTEPGDDDALLAKATTSVASHRTMDEIAAALDKKTWQSNRQKAKSDASDKRAGGTPGTARAAGNAALAKIPGITRAKLEDFVPPQLATLVEQPPDGEHWIHEIKIDGYRAYARRRGDEVRLLTRTGQDWTHRFGAIAKALARLPGKDLALDGEIAVLDERGTSNFAALQEALSDEIDDRMRYIVFDLLHLDGYDLRGAALADRKRVLRDLLGNGSGVIVYSDHVDASGPEVYQHACDLKLEGVISKRADLPYQSGRGNAWVKTKCVTRQEFVIGGFTDPRNSRVGIGALALGYYEDGALHYAGRVGTGFNQDTARDLQRRLKLLHRPDSPFASVPAAARRAVHWVEPKLVCEVDFASWTNDGMLRHTSFQGLREDKPAKAVGREIMRKSPTEKKATPVKKPADRGATVDGVTISHPDRVVFPEDGITKLQLVQYYEAVAGQMLPYIESRPLSLLRCPEGVGKDCFFQKHFTTGLKKLRRVSIKEKNGVTEYVMVRNGQDLISLIQEGVVEIHPWGALADRPDEPDQMIFDLDPAPDVDFAAVVAAAQAMREHLDAVGLRSFAKTTGGKGLHVIVPLRRGIDWKSVKEFARAVGENFVKASPRGFTINARKDDRGGKIFIDYLRNDRGSTAVAPYSVRARPGSPVAMPLAWREITPKLDPRRFTLATVPSYLAKRKQDPWADMGKLRQSISVAAKRALGLRR